MNFTNPIRLVTQLTSENGETAVKHYDAIGRALLKRICTGDHVYCVVIVFKTPGESVTNPMCRTPQARHWATAIRSFMQGPRDLPFSMVMNGLQSTCKLAIFVETAATTDPTVPDLTNGGVLPPDASGLQTSVMSQPVKFKAVRFDRYGGLDVLYIAELPLPVPGNGEVLVKVKAAGINPIETKIRVGLLAVSWPATFPCGEGSDFAGVVDSVGANVKTFAAGDEVIGFTNNRASHAEYVLVPMEQLTVRPLHVPWDEAGALFTSGSAAYATVKAVILTKGDTVVVSSAAGGVGSIVVQLAVNAGARVIGLASEDNHAWLKQKGVIPLDFDGDVTGKIKAVAGGRIDAFIDTYGHGYVDLAIQLGIRPDRIDTLVDPSHEAVKKYGVKNEGSMEASTAQVLAELAALIEQGRLEIPIAHLYKLEQVREAFAELEQHHTHGKIVLMP